MKIRLPLGLAFLLGAGWCLAAPGDKPPPVAPPESPDVVEFVHLGVTRPVFVRLHVSVDGKPYKRAWSEFMNHLFKSLDKNKDGVLSKEELARMPSPGQLFTLNNFGGGEQVVFNTVDADKDGKVTPQELSAYFEKSPLGGPLRFEFTQARRDPEEMLYGPGRGTPHTSDEMTEALLKLLDTNKDGKLSKEELAAAPEVLRKLDADDDDVISFAEFKDSLPYRSPRGYTAPVATPTPKSGKGKESPPQPFIKVQAGTQTTLGKQLLARYAAGNAKKLTLKASGLDEATFKQLDVDGDGQLDVEELARFTHRTPDLDLVIRLGKVAKDESRLAVSKTGDGPNALARHTRQTKETVIVNLDASQMEVESKADEGNKGSNTEILRQVYGSQFDAADKDGNGYLDEKEAKANGFFQNSFQAMDLDGDGKLFKKEMMEYLDKFIDLQARALASQVSVSAAEAGRGLFDLIDTNRDGRLSLREVRNAVKLLERLDRDGDGFLSATEVPRTYQVTVMQGPPDATPFYGPNFDPSQMFKPLPETAVGPLWFRKMDLNRDGDVSRREFIGTKEEFDRIDTDGDGLISVEEANKYDALKRRQNGKPNG